MAKRYLGYGYTNAQGVAKLEYDPSGNALSHSYTGVGAGKVDIVAESGTLQSEPYTVIDGVFYNSGVGATGDASFYNPANIDVQVESDGTLLTQSASSTALYYANIGTTGDLYDFTSSFCIEFDIISSSRSSSSSSGLGISLTEKNGTAKVKQFSALNITSNNHVKITVDGTNVIYKVDNNTPVSEAYTTTQVRVAFLLNSASMKFKNFVIYPI